MAGNPRDNKRAAAYNEIFGRPQSAKPTRNPPQHHLAPHPPYPYVHLPPQNPYYNYAPSLPPQHPVPPPFHPQHRPSHTVPLQHQHQHQHQHQVPPPPPSQPSQPQPQQHRPPPLPPSHHSLPYHQPPPPALHLSTGSDEHDPPLSPASSFDHPSSPQALVYNADNPAANPYDHHLDYDTASISSQQFDRMSLKPDPHSPVSPSSPGLARRSSESDRTLFYQQQQQLPHKTQHRAQSSSSSYSTLPYSNRAPSLYEYPQWTGSSHPSSTNLTMSTSAPTSIRSHKSTPSNDSSRYTSASTFTGDPLNWSPTNDFPLASGATSIRSFSGTTTPASTTLVPSQKSIRRSDIYPALLSHVAEEFKITIVLTERVKDGLSYASAFDGYEAVTLIADIIGTEDRNLALLLGRALDAQKFFHDVAYEHRLRDSKNEVYRLRERLANNFVGQDDHDDNLLITDNSASFSSHSNINSNLNISAIKTAALTGASLSPEQPFIDDDSYMDDADSHQSRPHAASSSSTTNIATTPQISTDEQYQQQQQQQQHRPASPVSTIDDANIPNGVFTLLTDCYSPTCSKKALCYSCACPRRLEQLKYLGETDPEKTKRVLQRQESSESLDEQPEPGTLWVHAVPQEVLDSVDEKEKKRQEAINEVIYTERDFVRDMEYLRDRWVKPLLTGTILESTQREDFVKQVFWNYHEIITVNAKLSEALNKRQKQHYVVEKIGDVFMDHVGNFAPFVDYGAHQLWGKFEFERVKASNMQFAKFVDETERLPESRKLELNGYLTKPTTRLARYPLLLEVVLKHTAEDHPDKTAIPAVIQTIKKFLAEVNTETGRSENRFELHQIDTQLVFKPSEVFDLCLRNEERELLYKGPLKKRGGGNQGESAELMVFLFDHFLVLTKPKTSNQKTTLKVYRKPIPIRLLHVKSPEDTRSSARQKALMARASSSKSGAIPTVKENSKSVPPLTITYMGKNGYILTLHAATNAIRKKWLEKIQSAIKPERAVVELVPICEGFFGGANRVTCAAPYDFGNKMVYGTDFGVYLHDSRSSKPPKKMIEVANVSQVDVLEEYGVLLVLAEKSLQAFNINALEPNDVEHVAKRAKKYGYSVEFFKTGTYNERTIVVTAKVTAARVVYLTIYEPIDLSARSKKQPGLRKLLSQNNQDLLKNLKVITFQHIHCTSVSFLKKRLCLGHLEGFSILDIDTVKQNPLINFNDPNLEFIKKNETCRPMAIFLVHRDYLLCYNEFAFYITNKGTRTRPEFDVKWESNPHEFALLYPYLLAFDSSLIEVRNCLTGELLHVVVARDSIFRGLFSDLAPAEDASKMFSSYYQQNSYGGVGGYGGQHPQMPHIRPSPYRRNHLVYFSSGDKIYRIRQIASKTPQHQTPPPHELQRPASSLSIAQQQQHHLLHHKPPPHHPHQYNMPYPAQVPFPSHLPSH